MEIRKCTKCFIDKSSDLFTKDKSKKSGYSSQCKDCAYSYKKSRPEVRANWEAKNKERLKVLHKKSFDKNKDKISAYNAEYKAKNREDLILKNKIYNDKNKESNALKSRQRNRIKSIKNKEIKQEKKRLYLLSEEYFEKEKIRKERESIKNKNRRETNPLFRLKDNLRARTRKAFRNKHTKRCTNSELLGISYDELYVYIESLFTEGMSWELFGNRIHIDHIIPLASATNEEELLKLCHYKNLQPLWAEDNMRKGDKII